MKVKITNGVSVKGVGYQPSDEPIDLPDGVARLLISQNQAIEVEAPSKEGEPTSPKSEAKEPEQKAEAPKPAKKKATKKK